MLMCLAVAGAMALTSPTIPDLAQEVETDARTLAAHEQATPEFLAGLADFSSDAMALSTALRATGMSADLPCIFKGISEDSAARAAAFQAATTDAERAEAFTELHVLLDDAILLAPMAARAATGEARPEDHAASATPEFHTAP
jgi:hypothetical protein